MVNIIAAFLILLFPLVIIIFIFIFIYLLINLIRERKYKNDLMQKASEDGIILWYDGLYPYNEITRGKKRIDFLLKWASEKNSVDNQKKVKDKMKLYYFYKKYKIINRYILFNIIYIFIFIIMLFLRVV